MPLFGLIPVADALHTPAWAASTYLGPCYVMAPDVRRARLHAANRFTNPTVRAMSGLLPASPWMMPAMVAVEVAFCLVDAAAPEGTIAVPDHTDDPHGTLRVLVQLPGGKPRGDKAAPP